MRKFRGDGYRWLLGLFWVLSVHLSFAAQNPQDMIQGTLLTLQQDISTQRASLQNSPQKLFALVKQVVMPHLDVNYMAALTVGPLWRKASKDQRTAFIDEFGLLLTRAYANALLKVTDYTLTFKPLAPGWESKQFIAVSGTIQPKSGGQQPSQVVYYLVQVRGEWKIYDFVVDGVSFLQNYRAQFQTYSDLNTLTGKLKDLNKDQG